jgi:hypothetical protein
MSRTDSANPGLWFAVFGAPAAWFVSLVAGYFSVHDACRHQSIVLPLTISLVALAISATSGIGGRALYGDAREHARTRFLAEISMMSGVVFSLIIVLQLLAILVVPPCRDRPRTPASPDVFRAAPAPTAPLA